MNFYAVNKSPSVEEPTKICQNQRLRRKLDLQTARERKAGATGSRLADLEEKRPFFKLFPLLNNRK